jgi:hypothetical protein
MPFINQLFRLSLAAPKALILLKSPIITAADITTNAITKGSADQAARGDMQYIIENKVLLEVDLREDRLIGTSLVGGTIYGAIVVRFYKKYKMAERLVIASRLITQTAESLRLIRQQMTSLTRVITEIAEGMIVAEYEMKMLLMTRQLGELGVERRRLTQQALLLKALNEGYIDTSLNQIMREGSFDDSLRKWPYSLKNITVREEITAVKDLLISVDRAGMSTEEVGIFKQLFNADDILGLEQTIKSLTSYASTLDDVIRDSQGMLGPEMQGPMARVPNITQIRAKYGKAGGIQSVKLVDAGLELSKLEPRVTSLIAASDDIAKAAGGLRKGAGIIAGKVFLIDSIIWGVTLGIDLGLNLFLSEEEQANLPIVGFLFEGAGWSPIGAIIEGVFDFFVDPETKQNLFQVFTTMFITATQEPTLKGLIVMILEFYVANISGEILVPLEFGQELNMKNDFSPLKLLDPYILLEAFAYACMAKIVYNGWITPAVGYLRSV